MKHLFTILFSFLYFLSFSQTTVFQFEFENTDAVTIDNAVGVPTFGIVGTLNTASYFGGSTYGDCPTTTGSSRSYAAWDMGDAYRFTVNTTGYTGLTFSCCMRVSNTNFGTLLIRASTDLASWSTILSSTSLTTTFAEYSGTLPSTFDNKTVVYIDVYKDANASSSTTNLRIDNATLIASSTLPISLSNFNANSNQKQVDLNWTKTNAQNFDKFVLEHSIDGNTFRSIDEINGNTGENYTFTHISPAIGTNYYRLKIMDLDGSYSYSPIVSAFVKSDKKWAVLPNQSVDNQIRVLSSDVNTTINIVDMNGKLILSLDSNGNPETLIQVGHLPKGLYTVQFFEGTNLVNNQRFVKQ